MYRGILTLLFVVSFLTLSFSQKLVFLKSYQSVKDIDDNNWTPSIRFAKGDTVHFVSLSTRNPEYYRVKSGIETSFVYKEVVQEADLFFELKRKKMDEKREIVLPKNLPPLKIGDTVRIVAARYGGMGLKIVTVEKGGSKADLTLDGFTVRPRIATVVDTLLDTTYLAEKEKDEKLLKERNYRLKAKYGEAVFNKMRKGIPWLGMSSNIFLEMFGEPDKVNRTVTSSVIREQWVYRPNKYYYFENGVLKSWQD
ncbi:MAG: hypothetical protein ACKO13_07095 [Cytophagales bacterium]